MTQKEFVKAVAADANEKLVAEGKKPITEGAVDTVIKSSVKVTTDALKAGDKVVLLPTDSRFISISKVVSL